MASSIPDRPEGARPIPGPRPYPVIGNMLDMPGDRMMQALLELSKQYGPMMVLQAADGPRYIASGLEMIDDLCDDSRFVKDDPGGAPCVRRGGARTCWGRCWSARTRTAGRCPTTAWPGW